MTKKISADEVAAHNTPGNVWIVVDGKVYDMTEFAPIHPGGPFVIHAYAGRDASDEYNAVHAPNLISNTLPDSAHIGELDRATITPAWLESSGTSQTAPSSTDTTKPPLSSIINLHDLERAAHAALPPRSWAFISTGANDNHTRALNTTLLTRILLRPRVLRSSPTVRTTTSIFGSELSSPIFICPTGTACIAGADGELALARAAVSSGIQYCISTPSSFPHAEVLAEVPDGRKIWFQLYVSKERADSEELLRSVVASGKIGAVFVTADLPVMSKREDDERLSKGVLRRVGAFIDPSFGWDDIPWVRGVVGSEMPIVLKGVQRADDVRRAMEMGCQGVQLSNHGGRAVDGAPPPILTLLECHKNCPEVFGQMEIFVDGGFRRGSDVVKAICLGASAVGIGRGFLYGVHYGQEGVEHAIDIIRDEIETAMQLSGMSDLIRDANPEYVNTGDIDHLVYGARHPYARKTVKFSKL